MGAMAFQFMTPSCSGPSTASRTSAVGREPMICCSWVMNGRVMRPGYTVSMVSPHRWAPKLLPGMA